MSTHRLSTNEEIEAFASGDSVKVTGYVDTITTPQFMMDKRYLVKFGLNNGTGKRLMCLAWQKKATELEPLIKLNQILHFNGAVAKKVDNAAYNLGNVPFELIIREHTEIREKGFYEDGDSGPSSAPEIAAWDNIADMEGRLVKISGWLKLNFNPATHKTGDAIYAIGAITNGEFELAVRVINFKDLPKNLTKGCPINAVGIVQYDGNNPFVKVAKGSNVEVIEGSMMDEDDMMEVVGMPRKKAKTA